MTDLDDNAPGLHEALQRAVVGPSRPVTLEDVRRAADQRRRARRLTATTFAGVGAVLVVAAAVVASRQGGDGSTTVDASGDTTETTDDAPEPAGPATVETPPLPAAAVVVSTPDGGVLVWGGEGPTGRLLDTGWRFDPAHGQVTDVPAPPFGARSGAVAASTDAGVVVCCGYDDDSRSSPAAALLATDSGEWEELPAPPESPVYAAAAWTGDEVVVVGGADVVTARPVAPMAFDPAEGAWRQLPDPPIELGRDPVAAWNGTRLVVTAGATGGEPGLALYDPATDAWELAPAPPFELVPGSAMAVVGDDIFYWGVRADDFGGPAGPGETVGGLLDLDSGTWRTVDPWPVDLGVLGEGETAVGGAAIGQKVLLCTIHVTAGQSVNLAVYDTATGTWDEAAEQPPCLMHGIFPHGDDAIVVADGSVHVIPL